MIQHMTRSLIASALDHLAAAQASASTMRDLYDEASGTIGRHVPAAVAAEHHNAIRFGHKVAEISALISIAASLEVLVGAAVDAEQVREVEALIDGTTPAPYRDRVRSAQPSASEAARRVAQARR